MKKMIILALAVPAALLLAAAAGAHETKGGQAPTGQKPPVKATPERVRAGKAIFARNCSTCHDPASTQTLVGPGLKGLFQLKRTPALGQPLTERNIRDHIHHGGGRMPAFPQIKGADMDALIAYLKSI